MDSLTNGLLSGFGGMGSLISDMCGFDFASYDIDLDLNFGGIFGRDFCELKDGFDDMLISGYEEKKRLLSVRCVKD
jgi:hypothetical protein